MEQSTAQNIATLGHAVQGCVLQGSCLEEVTTLKTLFGEIARSAQSVMSRADPSPLSMIGELMTMRGNQA